MSSTLADPEAILANRRGELGAYQRIITLAAVRSRGHSEWFMFYLGVQLMGLLIYAAFAARPEPAVRPFLYPILAVLSVPGAYGAWRAWKTLRRLDLARHELLAGRVDQAVGEVAWADDGYVARVRGLAAAPDQYLFRDGELNLLPGPYRFYFLPHSGWLLSATPLRSDAAHNHRDLLAVLARANKFTLDALALNRKGQLSAEQRAQLSRGLFWNVVAVLIVLLPIGGFIYFAWLAPNSPAMTACLTIGALIVALGVTVVGLWESWKLIADIRGGKVAMVTGPARKVLVELHASRQDLYYYRVRAMRFSVSASGYNALIDGLSYHLYYLPHTRILVSIEPLMATSGGVGD